MHRGEARGVIVEVADEQAGQPVDHERLRAAAKAVVTMAGYQVGEISIAVVDDERMHALNRQYLDHDYPTDVLSFVLEHDPDAKSLDGEIIVSADYAAREAVRYGWTAGDELLLYVIHGCLHLVGHDDQTPEAKSRMRAEEARFLEQFGLKHRFDT